MEPGSGKAETHWFTVDQKRIDGDISGAFIAFPGGTGTLEKIAEVMSKVSLKQLDAPCILYNLNGYYNSLKELLTINEQIQNIAQKKDTLCRRMYN